MNNENVWLVQEYHRTIRIRSKKDKLVVSINKRKFWKHVVELAEFIHELVKKANTRQKKESLDQLVNRLCKEFKSLRKALKHCKIQS